MTARFRQNELCKTGIQFETEIVSTRFRGRTPTGTGAESPAKSANGSRASRRLRKGNGMSAEQKTSLRQQGRENVNPPFPFPPRGDAGAGGFPPRRQNTGGSPHKRGHAPLVRSPRGTIVNFVLDRGRPSHGSRKRQRPKLPVLISCLSK